ncbi:hypothetical protein Tdes44962_MAKER05477 [Teratosphaeria destructans]|uniref:Uncharacterized protein n=1 Tax=Teratosphaeria destructans TaxID=418781 RepID=A0A9W7SJP2_9PEZI|nr:hypothetical protein Tdes44962_MAKER05477 [Teratosphaeria destructans]
MGGTLSKEEEARIAQKQREEIDAFAAKYKAQVISAHLSRVRAHEQAKRRAKKEAARLNGEAAQSKTSAASGTKAKGGASVVPPRPKKILSDTNMDVKGMQKVIDGPCDERSSKPANKEAKSSHLKRKSSARSVGPRKRPLVLGVRDSEDEEEEALDLDAWQPRKERLQK